MYIRKASRTYKGKTYYNYCLVESVLTPKGPRQKVICSLGDLSPRPKHEWLALARKLEAALGGQQSLPGHSGGPEVEALVTKVKAARLPVLPAPDRETRCVSVRSTRLAPKTHARPDPSM
jgi:hypothetical protein